MDITVLITTSTNRFQPDTAITESCLASVRRWLPDARIVLLCDGVWPEWESRRAAYEEYKKRLQADNKHNIEIREFSCLHQTGMLREILPSVTTPFVLFLEHDVSLMIDVPIEWDNLCKVLENGHANIVRFLLTPSDFAGRSHLMRGDVQLYGCQFVRTVDWRSAAFLSTREYLDRIIRDHTIRSLPMMIEKAMSWFVANSDWETSKVLIYRPVELEGQRIRHLNARLDDARNFYRDDL